MQNRKLSKWYRNGYLALAATFSCMSYAADDGSQMHDKFRVNHAGYPEEIPCQPGRISGLMLLGCFDTSTSEE